MNSSQPPTDPPTPAPDANKGPKAKLLYVDDESVNLLNFSMTFEDDFEIVTAKSGEEALATFRRHKDFAIIVADQRMGGMSGIELLERIYTIDPDPIRIILTGYTDVEDIIDAINKGHVYNYIVKPWDEKSLRITLDRAFDTYRLFKENRELSRRVIQVAEEERRRLARDLHDEIGQMLPGLRYNIEAVHNAIAAPDDEQEARFAGIYGMLEELGDICRRISCELRPDMLDRLGLIETIRWSIGEFGRRFPGIDVELALNGGRKEIPPDIAIVLFRVFQESMNNIAKHADARHVTIIITFNYPNVILAIRDDGQGFEVGADTAGDGIGLIGMRERITSVEGTLTIRSKPREGTLIRTEVPIA